MTDPNHSSINLEVQLRKEILQKSIDESEAYLKLLEELKKFIAEAVNMPSRFLRK